MKKTYELLELRHLLLEIQEMEDWKLRESWPMLEDRFYELYVSAFGKEQLPVKFYYSALDIPESQYPWIMDKRTMEEVFRSEFLDHGKKNTLLIKDADKNWSVATNWFDSPSYRFFVALRQLMNRKKEWFYLKLFFPPTSCGLDTPLMKMMREMNLA